MFVLDSEKTPVSKGDLVKCLEPIDGLTLGAKYEVKNVQPEALRLVIINDFNKEQWVSTKRFKKTRQPYSPGDLVRRVGKAEVLEVISYCPVGKVASLKDDRMNLFWVNAKDLEKLQLELELE